MSSERFLGNERKSSSKCTAIASSEDTSTETLTWKAVVKDMEGKQGGTEEDSGNERLGNRQHTKRC